MLGPRTLSMVDMVCREVKQSDQAFGGLQVLLVGDFFQLPPVVERGESEFQKTLIEEATARFAYDAPCWLTTEVLRLKVGAKVMFTKNNPQAGFVNGTLGEVRELNSFGSPVIGTRNNRSIIAEPMAWTVEEGGSVMARITQVPLRLAWAITVHKSQGMSLDEAVMDLTDVFEFGQGYVALSRVRRLSGLYLLGWNKQTFQVHPEVLEKDIEFRKGSKVAREAFEKISPDELAQMHKNFIRAVGC